MTVEEFEALVRRLEPQARENPKAYGRKVALLAGLGYAFIGLALLVVLAVAALVVALAFTAPALLKFLIPLGAFALIVLRALWVKLDAPAGFRLEPENAPELFRMIDEVNKEVRGPKVHQVLVTGDLNAGIVQIPRRGGIFGQRNYLLIGLPYMQALSPDEFRAVVAHELGHLSRRHGRFGTWIYRVRATWWQLLRGLEEKRNWGNGIFRRFFEWYAPYFNAYTFPLMRAHELEADDAAARAAGARPAATALLSATVAGRYLAEEYWPKLYERVKQEPEPPRTAFAPLRQELTTAKRHEDVADWLDQELARPAALDDTHPSVADRIRHLGLTPEDVAAVAGANGASSGPTAAQAYLGEREAELAQELDRAWRESVGDEWRTRYERAQQEREMLAELEERAQREPLDLDDRRALAVLTYDLRGPEQALPRYEQVLEIAPDDARANFDVGRILLSQGDEKGLSHFERAMEVDPDAVLPACEAAYLFLKERARDDEAEQYRRRAEERYEALEEAQAERAEVKTGGDLLPHDLPPAVVAQVASELAGQRDVKKAYLVRRRMEHLDDEFPLYVLYVVPRRTPWKPFGGNRHRLVARVASELDLPFQFWVVSPGAFSLKTLRVRRIRGARVFAR